VARPSETEVKLVRFGLFVAVFLAIVGVILGSKSLLIAPPFAVSAYTVVFQHSAKYSETRSIAASYVLVIASSVLLEEAFGAVLIALVVNVLLISLFITFTRFSHPPAIALTIFSYLIHDPVLFAFTSSIVLAIVVAASILFERIPATRRYLDAPIPIAAASHGR
jgi:hypothetical protein